jgi:hypothetical protein
VICAPAAWWALWEAMAPFYLVCFIAWCIEQCEVWWLITWWFVHGFMWCMLDASELAGAPANAASVPATASRRIAVELIFIGPPPIEV